MIDHNKRIRKQLLDAKVEPLAIVVAVLIVALLVNSSLEAYAAYKYKSQIDAANVFASCLNGQKIEIGDSWARCKVEKLTLVSGARQ
jgi:hypothetical protein